MRILLAGMLLLSPLGAQYTASDLTPKDRRMTTRATAVAGGVAVGYNSVPGSPAFYNDHAALWSADGKMTDLHPTAYAASQALAAADGKQAGFAIPMSFSGTRAVMWSGDLTSVVDLHPAGFRSSRATCVSAGEQAGYASNSLSLNHAILWRGSPESAVDLQPARWVETFVYGCAEGRQVGSALQTGGGNVHAVLWAGSADSVVDLNPEGIDASVAYGIGKDQQVGRGSGAATGGNDHALLWSGAAAGVVDLHPAAFVSSVAYASNGAQQAGAALALESGVMRSHAVVWSGTADSAVDLNQYLPQGMVEAVAWGIDADGNVAGTATDATGAAHAIVWRTSAPPAPKPAAPGALAAVSVTPGTIYGLNSVQGAVTLDAPAGDGGLAVALASSDAGRVAVPASVTVPAGQLGATFAVTAVSGGAAATVTIAAAANGVTRSTTVAAAPPADTVKVGKANYVDFRLLVQATSSNPAATLSLYVTGTGEYIGEVPNQGGGQYGGTVFVWATDPGNVTVRSNFGGSDSSATSPFDIPHS